MFEKVRELIEAQLELKLLEHGGPGKPEGSFTQTLYDLGADSLDVVQLSVAFETEFGIEISNHQMDKLMWMNVKQISAKIAELKKR